MIRSKRILPLGYERGSENPTTWSIDSEQLFITFLAAFFSNSQII